MNPTNKGRTGGYNCVVCIKQVPDTSKVTGKAMKDDGTINRAALPAIFNPEDMNALEAALKVKETCGGTVTVVTMGLPAACAILRTALMCGADKAYLLTDRKAAGSDTLATSYILSQAVKKFNPDLVFCGRQAIDGDTAQVGPQIAEKLNLPQVTYAEEIIEAKDGKVTVKRRLENGVETVRAPYPCVVTVNGSAAPCRPRNAKNLQKFKYAAAPSELAQDDARKPLIEKRPFLGIGEWNAEYVGADLNQCGLAGSPTKVKAIENVVFTAKEARNVENTDQALEELIQELIVNHTIG